jgi:hypothetical protein
VHRRLKLAIKYRKTKSDQGFAPDPTGELIALPRPPSWRGGHPSGTLPSVQAPQPSRMRRSNVPSLSFLVLAFYESTTDKTTFKLLLSCVQLCKYALAGDSAACYKLIGYNLKQNEYFRTVLDNMVMSLKQT